MANLQLLKVSAFPASPLTDAIYFKKGASDTEFEIKISDNSGSLIPLSLSSTILDGYVKTIGDTMTGTLTVNNGTGYTIINSGSIFLNTGEDGTASSKMFEFKNTNGGGVWAEKRGGFTVNAQGDSATGKFIFKGLNSGTLQVEIGTDGTYDSNGYIISTKARLYDSSEETISSTGTTTINPSLTPARNFTLQSDRVIQFSTGYSASYSWSAVLRFKQDATGGRVITWSGSGQQVKWQGGIAPIIASDPNAVTFISLYWDGVDLYGYQTCGF